MTDVRKSVSPTLHDKHVLMLPVILIPLSNIPEAQRGLNTRLEPSHKIMTLFVLRKLILQMRMRSHSEGLDV